MPCSSEIIFFASVDKANISNAHARASFAFIYDLGWDSHEIETLHLVQLQSVCDGAGWHWCLWKQRRALKHPLGL